MANPTGKSITGNTTVTTTAHIISKNITVSPVPTGVTSYTITISKGTLGTMPSGYTDKTATAGKTAATTTTAVPYGSVYKVAWTGSSGYTLNKTTDSHTVSNETAYTFVNPTATLNSYTITFNKNANATYILKNAAGTTVATVTSGTGTQTYTGAYGTYYLSLSSIANGYSFNSFTVT